MTVAAGSAETIADRGAHPKSDAEALAILLLAVPGSLPLPSGSGSPMIWGSLCTGRRARRSA